MSYTDELVSVQFQNDLLTDSSGATLTLTGTIIIDYLGTASAPIPVVLAGALYAGGETITGVNIGMSGTADALFTGLYNASPATTFAYSTQVPASLATAIISYDNTFYTLAPGDQPLISTVLCFASGTLIRTPHGDVPVEALKAGDHVLTASGERRPIKWLGHRTYGRDFGPTPRRHEVVRIAADAFGPDLPSLELIVSPGHSICLDLFGEVLIPAMNLVNGATVARAFVDEVALWHVELDSHDILVANNLPAESYLAMGNRGFFEEAGATLETFEEGETRTHADFCRPVAVDGEIPAFVRNRLTARALKLGWTPSYDDDLRLVVDGRVRRPLIDRDAAAFLFPAGARDVRLVSSTFTPGDFGSDDTRVLGVLLTGLVFCGGNGEARCVAIDDERLREGVSSVEGGATRFRWTTGELVLDPQLWDGLSGAISLHVSCRRGVVRGWIAPATTEERTDAKPRLYAVR